MSESWPDPEYLRQFREAAKLVGRAQRLKDDALRAAADARTLAELEAAGFNCIGILCNRCAHATNLAIDGELRKRKGLTLEDLAKLLYCTTKREPVRHHDVTLKPLRPNERWP